MIKSNIITYRSISNLWVTITTSSNPYIWILRDEWGLLCHLLPWGILMSSLLCVFSYGNHSCWKFRGLSGLSYLENGISCQRYKKLFMDSPKACSGCSNSIYTYICVYVCICICIYVYTHAYACVCMCIPMYMCVHVLHLHHLHIYLSVVHFFAQYHLY